MHSARNFAVQEQLMENSATNLKKMSQMCILLDVQCETLLKSTQHLEEVKEQVCAMQR